MHNVYPPQAQAHGCAIIIANYHLCSVTMRSRKGIGLFHVIILLGDVFLVIVL